MTRTFLLAIIKYRWDFIEHVLRGDDDDYYITCMTILGRLFPRPLYTIFKERFSLLL